MDRVDSVKACFFCGKAEEILEESGGTLKKCDRCKKALYCNRTCQKSHWPIHKKICKEPQKNSKSERVFNNRINSPSKVEEKRSKNRRVCGFCKKETYKKGEFKKCFKCHEAYYCNKICQKKGWKKHRENCEFKFSTSKWSKFSKSLPLETLLGYLANEKSGDILYLRKIIKLNGNMGISLNGELISTYKLKLFQKKKIEVIEGRSIGRYYNALYQKGYVKTLGFKRISEDFCIAPEITKKGRENLDKIQEIAFESALDVMCECFNQLLKEKGLVLLKDKDFEKLFIHRKNFVFYAFLYLRSDECITAFQEYFLAERICYVNSKKEYSYEGFQKEIENQKTDLGANSLYNFLRISELKGKILVEEIFIKEEIEVEKFKECLKVIYNERKT